MKPSTRHIRVPDVWFEENDDVTGNVVNSVEQNGIYLIVPVQGNPGVTSHTKPNFLPSGIVIGRSTPESTAVYEVINGWLFGESLDEIDTYRLEIGRFHPLSFAGFAFNNTSARSIRIFGN